MNELFEQTKKLSDEKIEAMMNYPTFYFKKENRMGVYRLSIDKKTIKAPNAETAKIMAGEGWQLIVDNPYIPKEIPKGTTLEQWERYAEDMERHEERVRREKPNAPPLYFTHYKPTPNWPTHAETAEEAYRIYNKAKAEWEMMSSCDEPNKPGYYRANND